MSLEESFMQGYQKLSPQDTEQLHQIIIKHLGEKLPLSGGYPHPFPLDPPRAKCPNCGTFITK
jgi:hypothetical protein